MLSFLPLLVAQIVGFWLKGDRPSCLQDVQEPGEARHLGVRRRGDPAAVLAGHRRAQHSELHGRHQLLGRAGEARRQGPLPAALL